MPITPVFITGFEPPARMILLLADKSARRRLAVGSLAYHSVADTYRKYFNSTKAVNLKTAKERWVHSRE